MLAVEKWATDKSPFLAFIAIQHVISAQDYHLAFKQLKAGKIMGYQFDFPSLPLWLSFYRHHRRYVPFFPSLVGEFAGFSQQAVDSANLLFHSANRNKSRSFEEALKNSNSDDMKKGLDAVSPYFKMMLSEVYDLIKKDIKNKAPILEKREQLLAQIQKPEGVFSLFAFLPCLILHKDHPTRIYRKARQGNFEAMNKLLMIDSSLLHDPSIGAHIINLQRSNKSYLYDRLMNTSAKAPRKKIDAQRFKYSFAGLISLNSHFFHCPFTENDIRKLFDAVWKDYHGEDIDPDIADSHEGFQKAIQRERAEWLNFYKADRKN